jgi:hypothetical protein
MHPTPSPDPLLIQVVGGGDGAPWWGVPVIAGGFLIVGGFLSYLWTRSNDKRRGDRERSDALTEELVELTAEFVALGSKFSTLAEKSLVTPLDEFLPELVHESTELIGQHSVLFNRARLVMPQSIQLAVQKYSAACISLTFPPFGESSMTPRMNNYVQSEQDLVNALRRLRGLTDLVTTGGIDTQEKRIAFADRVTDQLVKTMNDNGIEIVDGKKKPTEPPTVS